MTSRILLLLITASLCWAESGTVAAKLARSAREAQNSGHLVRAYLLFAEAAARDPKNPTYRANRDALEPVAKLLVTANVETADVSADVKEAENTTEELDPTAVLKKSDDTPNSPDLQPIPAVQTIDGVRDFDLDADEKTVLQQVASAYGVRAIWDPQLLTKPHIGFHLEQVDFHAAMEALTAATGTFVFPINAHTVFFADDNEMKRAQLEPTVALSIPLPNALDQKDLAEAATAARTILGLRAVVYDSASRTIIVTDRASRARIARALLEALLLPKPQVSIQIELMTVDTDRSYHYGLAVPTSYQAYNFGFPLNVQSTLSTVASAAATYLTFGGGASLFGIGSINANLFATFSKSIASKLYDATVVAGDGQEATLHVGDKYPIPQSLYSGFQQAGGSIYNPIGQVSYQDLGLLLKVKAHVNGQGEISLEIEAHDDALGTQTIDTVPTITERVFKGNVTLREGQWAVVTGLDADTSSRTRSGWPGLSQVAGLNEVLAENTREHQTSKVLLVIKPTITRLPMSETVSPQYLLGPRGGERVVL